MISAKVIEDSISPDDKRLLTFELSYPRFIHGEVLTHRVFSRNAMSSRAVPVSKMIEQVRTNPVVPIVWGLNQPGMQSYTTADSETAASALEVWMQAAGAAAYAAEKLTKLNIHKQFANRLLEPFQWMKTIVTATEWENFFELRNHPAAEPHFQHLAWEMVQTAAASTPVLRGVHPMTTENWHLPYVLQSERETESFLQLAKVSAARCARVSYLTHDNKAPSLEADIALYDRLVGSNPKHASPIEHQAFPLPDRNTPSGNFRGWMQYRQLESAHA